MKTKHLRFDQINFAAYNPRVALKPADPEYQAIRNSLTEFGFLGGLVVNIRTTPPTLVAGHQRVTILRDMGQTGADFATVSLNSRDEKRLNLIMNKVAGRWSAPDLGAILRELQAEQIDLASLGFHNPTELQALLTGPEKKTSRDPDDAPTAPDDSRAYTKSGDVYDLRTENCHHRLMCGSSTEPKDMAKLCGDHLAQICFTDPPYGVSYKGATRNPAKEDLIANDDLRGEQLRAFLAGAFRNVHRHAREDAALYCFYASSNHIQFETALQAAGWRVKQVLNWIKSMVLGRSDYHWAHEPILYGSKLGQNCQWFGPRTETTIFETSIDDLEKLNKEQAIAILRDLKAQTTAWEEKKDPPSILQHPNQKPTSLAARALRNSSLPGHHCIEPFAGSGSTLIACELHDRHCLAIELSRGHCDAIIRRFAETFPDSSFKKNGRKFNPENVHAAL